MGWPQTVVPTLIMYLPLVDQLLQVTPWVQYVLRVSRPIWVSYPLMTLHHGLTTNRGCTPNHVPAQGRLPIVG